MTTYYDFDFGPERHPPLLASNQHTSGNSIPELFYKGPPHLEACLPQPQRHYLIVPCQIDHRLARKQPASIDPDLGVEHRFDLDCLQGAQKYFDRLLFEVGHNNPGIIVAIGSRGVPFRQSWKSASIRPI